MSTGTVKFFNGEKGYGFISREGAKDVFVHYSNIVGSGYRTLEADQKVEFEVQPGRKGNEVVYTYSDAEMKQQLAEAQRRGVRVKDPIQRYKGLGEMDARQLKETTMAREHRLLRRVTVDDAEEAAGVFDLLMGSDVAPRKEFIVSGADELDRSRVDV